jgi:nitroreductase
MTLYETIFTRRAVRKYEMELLDQKTFAALDTFIATISQMRGQQARLEVVTADKVNDKTAPYYILAYCKETAEEYANVGFTLQAVDLYLQSTGLGSGWLNSAKPKVDAEDFCIGFAFGKTSVPPRKGAADFKRLELSEISEEENAVAKAVRLAPSAINTQPWKLQFEKDKVVLHQHGRGLARAMLKKKFNKIDLGIAARHAVVALHHEGKQVKSVIPKTTDKEFTITVSY